jgi:hypothetical protein
MAKTAGTWQPFVDAEPVRQHIAELAAAGIGQRRVAELAGLDRSVLCGLVYGKPGRAPSAKVRPETAKAILAVLPSPAALAAESIINGTGTARRVRALCAIGWSLHEQARRVGWSCGNYAPLAGGHPVIAATARLVTVLYDELSMTPAPAGYSANRARQFALNRHWAPPLAWDDEAIDDPAAKPHPYVGQRPPETPAEFVARYLPLTDRGLTWAEIAAELGLSADAAKSRIKRARDAGLLAGVNA